MVEGLCSSDSGGVAQAPAASGSRASSGCSSERARALFGSGRGFAGCTRGSCGASSAASSGSGSSTTASAVAPAVSGGGVRRPGGGQAPLGLAAGAHRLGDLRHQAVVGGGARAGRARARAGSASARRARCSAAKLAAARALSAAPLTARPVRPWAPE